MNFFEYVLCFFIYAFLGYICEVIYCSIGQRKLVNRGYLYSPICPIYGYGSVLVLLTMTPIKNLGWWAFIIVFFAGTLLVTILEYLTSYFMELFFHMRWWDYSRYKFHINGRVCLLNSTLFGLCIMALMYLIQPFICEPILNNISSTALYIVDGILLAIMAVDTVFSTIKNINIAKVIAKMNEISHMAGEKLGELKVEATEILNELKTETVTTVNNAKQAVALKLKELTDKYPNLKLRKLGKDRTTADKYIDENLDKENKE